jgi:DNA-binding transcriptional ArsR family regulator
MVEHAEAELDRVFRALGSAPRREILRMTAGERRSVSELAQHFDMSLAAVAKHVHVLVDAELVSLTQEGRVHYCRLKPETLDAARLSIDDLRRFWNARLDALERVAKGGARSKKRGS